MAVKRNQRKMAIILTVRDGYCKVLLLTSKRPKKIRVAFQNFQVPKDYFKKREHYKQEVQEHLTFVFIAVESWTYFVFCVFLQC